MNQAETPSPSYTTTTMSDGSDFQTAMSLQSLTMLTPSIHLQSNNSEFAPTIDIEDLGHKWTLNPEQLQAFRTITEHSLCPQNNPLRMFIFGPAGTGKTRVINIVKDFFEQQGQMR